MPFAQTGVKSGKAWAGVGTEHKSYGERGLQPGLTARNEPHCRRTCVVSAAPCAARHLTGLRCHRVCSGHLLWWHTHLPGTIHLAGFGAVINAALFQLPCMQLPSRMFCFSHHEQMDSRRRGCALCRAGGLILCYFSVSCSRRGQLWDLQLNPCACDKRSGTFRCASQRSDLLMLGIRDYDNERRCHLLPKNVA